MTSIPARARAALLVIALLGTLAGALMIVGALSPTRAEAHANIESADPAADAALPVSPTRLRMRFTEPLSPALSALQVLDTAGQRVDRDDSTVDPADPQAMTISLQPGLPPGTYTVFWRNVSTVDGHALRGTYVFYIGDRPANAPLSATPSAPLFNTRGEPVARTFVLAGLLTAFGMLLFEFAVATPVIASGDARGRAAELPRTIRRRLRRAMLAALALCVAGSLAHLAVQAMASSGEPLTGILGSPLRAAVVDTRWGRFWALRMALIALAAAPAAFALRPAAARRPGLRAAAAVAALIALAGAMLTLSLTSHGAATAGIETPALSSDWVHLLAAGAWGGSLLAMALAVDAARRLPQPEPRRVLLRALTRRFSPIAVIATGALLVTGLFSAWAQVTAVSALGTTYGRTLVVKVALFVALIVLGAINLRVLGRRLAQSDRAGGWLSRIVRAELALIALVVVAAALLTSMEPARQTASREAARAGAHFELRAETTRIVIDVQPATTGANRVVVRPYDTVRGTPVDDATRVALRVQYAGADLGAGDLIATRTAPGTYVADGAQLSLAGTWQIEVEVDRPDALTARTAFRFDVASPGGAGARIAPGADAGNRAWAWEAILIGGLALAVANVWWSRERLGRVVNGVGTGAVVIGIILFFGAGHSHPTPAAGGLVNPFPPTQQSINLGRATYAGLCVGCHGARGLGDGPEGVRLTPPPANLVSHVPLHSDGDVFNLISRGFPATGMPPWGGVLAPDAIWHLVNFLRTLDGQRAVQPATAQPSPTAQPPRSGQ